MAEWDFMERLDKRGGVLTAMILTMLLFGVFIAYIIPSPTVVDKTYEDGVYYIHYSNGVKNDVTYDTYVSFDIGDSDFRESDYITYLAIYFILIWPICLLYYFFIDIKDKIKGVN